MKRTRGRTRPASSCAFASPGDLVPRIYYDKKISQGNTTLKPPRAPILLASGLDSLPAALVLMRRSRHRIVLTGALLVAVTACSVAVLGHALGLLWGPTWASASPRHGVACRGRVEAWTL
ncbi:hypothetical protein [Streptomyces sp. NPDC056983]|uniref:hypothetical protein n=1 Tax=Streptomyces sp. NPDC056983 TaxID=3345987 RepID=UPI00362B7C6E